MTEKTPDKIMVSWWPTRPRAWSECHTLAEAVTRCKIPARIGVDPHHSHGFNVYAMLTGPITMSQAERLRKLIMK